VSSWRLIWWTVAPLGLLLWVGMTSRVGSWLMVGPISVICWAVAILGVLLATGAMRSVPGLPRLRGRDHGWLMVGAAVLGLLVAYLAVPRSAEELKQQQVQDRAEEARQRQNNARYRAAAACQVYIEERLKVPSSAKFSLPPHIEQTERGYLVGGRLEAQNTFGVMLRRTYGCSVDANGHVLEGRLAE
jgi:hypothetical protein